MPETVARLRYHQASASKVRQVMHLIVGKDVNDAREILRFCERGPADTVMKVLDSAIANAEHNDNMPEDELFVVRAFADEGPTLKRGRPRARGRYGRLKKRSSHLTVVVARYDDDELERRRRREAEAGAPARQSRSRRVSASRRRAEAEEHDRAQEAHDHDEHDHEGHDHDHDDVDESLVDELETSSAEDEAEDVAEDEVDETPVAEDEVEGDEPAAADAPPEETEVSDGEDKK
jgi:large subunit ribosomal protein L22